MTDSLRLGRILNPCPDAYFTVDAGVQWLDGAACWLVTVQRGYNNDGVLEFMAAWQGHYGAGECATGYQALMLGLSDWRKSR